MTVLYPASRSNASAREPQFSAPNTSWRKGTVGAIAFSRSGDLSSGTFEDAQLLKKFGEAPDDLSAL
jgi:hypothetical protein